MKTAVNEEIYAAPTRCRTTKHGYEVSMVRIRAMAKRRKIRQEYEKEVRLHAWSVILRADNDLHVHTTHSLNHHVPVSACDECYIHSLRVVFHRLTQECTGEQVVAHPQHLCRDHRINRSRVFSSENVRTPRKIMYDDALAVFSPDGRLIQVENAQKASDQGNLIAFSCVSKRISVTFDQRLLDRMRIEPSIKLHLIDADQNIWLAFSGLRPDALRIISEARYLARQYRYTYMVDISLRQLAGELAMYMQRYTITRGVRPFGVRVILFGVEECARAFVVGPDGNYSEYKACAIGQKADKAVHFLEGNLRDDCVWNSVSAVRDAAQNDFSKMVTYLIDENGMRVVEREEINV